MFSPNGAATSGATSTEARRERGRNSRIAAMVLAYGLASATAHAQSPAEGARGTTAPPTAAPAASAPAAAPSTPAAAPTTASGAAADQPPPLVTIPPTAPPAGDPNWNLQSADGAQSADALAAEPGEIDVIKVTVDRREKRLQDYAGSASVYTQEDLERVNVTSVRELSNVSPSMEIGTQEGNTEVFIRGVGSTNNTELGDPSAATHIDGVYIPRPRGVGAMFFDLERVEVNRGPQGTLRGRNAVAGSLNLITAKPKLGEWGAQGSFQIGNYAQRLARAVVNAPIADRLALRFATFSEVHSPFYKNGGPIHTLQASESADTLAHRLTAKWVPLDNVTLLVGYDYTHEGGTGYSGSNFASALAAGLLPEEVPNPRRVIYRGPQGRQNLKHGGLHADLTVDMDFALVSYLGSYRKLDYNQVSSGNAGVVFPGMQPPDLDNWSTSYWHTTSKSNVHELRLYAPDRSRFRWTLGGFYFRERQTAFLGQTADKSDAYAGNEFNMPDVKGESQAGYADATFDITRFLRGTGGVRFTHENKSRTGVGNVYGFNTGGMPFRFGTEGFRFVENRPTFMVGGMNPAEVFTSGIAQYGARDTLGTGIANGTITAAPWARVVPQTGSYKDNFIDFRVGADADVARGHLVYANFTTGHASGGFNDNVMLPAGVPSIGRTYKPEALYATEVGSKNEFFDRKLRVNIAAFWYEYRDMVLQTVRQVSPPGVSDPSQTAASAVRDNVAKARILGAELDSAWRLPRGFSIGVNAMLLRARAVEGTLFDNRVTFDPDQTGMALSDRVDISGNTLPRSPTLTVNYSLGQAISTSVGWFDWIVSAQTRSKYYLTIFNGEGVDPTGMINPNLSDIVPSYTRIDAGVGYTRPDGKTRIDGFVSNLTDATYATTLINTPGLNLRFFNPPRQMGVRLSLYF